MVIAQVAPLAHGFQVRRGAVLGLVVQVRNGQADLAFGPLRIFAVNLYASPWAWIRPVQAALAFALAAPARTLSN